MPVYWVAQTATRVGQALAPTPGQIIDELNRAAVLLGGYMAVISGACWLFCDQEPQPRDIYLTWDVDAGAERCCEHPYGGCGNFFDCGQSPQD